MPEYCVNTNAQTNGDHEVHDLSANCAYLPAPANQHFLGWHADCRRAVDQAKTIYTRSNGCYHCARECHTT